MNSYFYHIQFNVNLKKNKGFYSELMKFLGWDVIFEGDKVIGFKTKTNGDLWFVDASEKEIQDYDDIGANHVSLRVDEMKDVDSVVEFLKEKGIPTLFETPRHRPEFSADETQTYYQVMFETPDKILFEIVYIGSK